MLTPHLGIPIAPAGGDNASPELKKAAEAQFEADLKRPQVQAFLDHKIHRVKEGVDGLKIEGIE